MHLENAMPDKKTIRRRVLTARRALSSTEVAEKSAIISAHVRTLPEFKAASTILTYVASKDNEVDTKPLIKGLLAEHRPVLVPTTLGKGQMVWSRLEAMEELALARFGVLEPRPEYRRDTVPPPDSLVLVPGLAFTETGWRIGYGGGYFDRFLTKFSGPKIALAYAMQMVPEIPVAPFDVPMDVIVNETGIHRCRRDVNQ
ncbi:MAG: 5-formyltetrahydrofolate cyclo-ligase [Candidatus Hydrogenedentota bacterium]